MIATAKTKDRRAARSKPRRPHTVVPQIWLATFQCVLQEASKMLGQKPVKLHQLRRAVHLAADRWDG
jgi:hypothetical protein